MKKYDDRIAQWARSNHKNQSERDQLIASTVPLALHIVRQYATFFRYQDDLTGAAMEGLTEAANRFNSKKGMQFSTFATPWIRKCVIEAMCELDQRVSMPRSMQRLRIRVAAERERLTKQNGYEATPEEVSDILHVPLSDVESLWVDIRVVSLEVPMGSDDEDSLHLADVLGSEDERPVDENTEQKAIEDLLHRLTPQQSEIFIRHYFYDEDSKTIGRAMKISSSRVRQIYRQVYPILLQICRFA